MHIRPFVRKAAALALMVGAALASAPAALAAPPLKASAPNMEPAFDLPEQNRRTAEKMARYVKEHGRRPNILIMLVDDMGWGDAGVYGGGIVVGAATPNIDRMANAGLRLTSTYSQPTCSPTRATMMTGRLPIRHGVLRPPIMDEPGGIEGEITAAQVLADNGYRTALVGKWHLGEAETQQPQNVGYDEFYGFLGVSTIYSQWRDPIKSPEVYYSPERTAEIEARKYSKDLVRAVKGGKIKSVKEIDIPVLANLDQDFAKYSEDFIERAAKDNKPFYLVHAFSKVHWDNYPADGYHGKSLAKHPYKDALTEVDDIVGRLLTKLEETGLAEDTFVFFTSDNGPEESAWPDTAYSPFRSGKGSTWEGGVRVPGIAYWPGMISAGRVSDGLFDLADLFNTSLALGGAQGDMPTDRYIDGIDQASFLLDDEGQSRRDAVFMYIGKNFSAVRWREYKAHLFTVRTQSGAVEDMGVIGNGFLEQTAMAPHVYNLYLDPKERIPIAHHKMWTVPYITTLMLQHGRTMQAYPPKKPSIAGSYADQQ